MDKKLTTRTIVMFWFKALKLLKSSGAFQTQNLCNSSTEEWVGEHEDAGIACEWFVKHEWLHEVGEGVYTLRNGPLDD